MANSGEKVIKSQHESTWIGVNADALYVRLSDAQARLDKGCCIVGKVELGKTRRLPRHGRPTTLPITMSVITDATLAFIIDVITEI